MKTTLVVTALAIIFACSAFAQVTRSIEFQNEWPKEENYSPGIEIYLHDSVAGNLNWWGRSFNSLSWGETYAGFAYTPTSWLEGGIAYGIENADRSGRFGSFAWIGDPHFYAVWLYENGRSGPWHRAIVNLYFTKGMGLGVMEQRELGNGPRLEVKLDKFVCWSTMLQRAGKPTASFLGLRYTF